MKLTKEQVQQMSQGEGLNALTRYLCADWLEMHREIARLEGENAALREVIGKALRDEFAKAREVLTMMFGDLARVEHKGRAENEEVIA